MAPNETISAEWTSCPFCSRSGLITVKLMAWHSPTADLQLCWRFMENIETQTKKCATVRRWTQFDYTISRFAVPRERRLQVAAPTLYPTVILNQSPLYEIFGKEFAEFLREDFDTTEQDRAELEAAGLPPRSETEVHQPQRPQDPIIHLLSGGLLDIDSLRCNTTGGCLFDRSMCSYQNSDLSDKASFRMVSVMNQHFVQASVPPGGIAILEVETRFREAHLVVFDLLEFSEGGKLSACCLKPQNQPQATIPVGNQILSVCNNLNELMFVCENYGRLHGSCSLDNIRLHKTADVLELEPCQKNVLRST
uniref:Uncharacterized protein n=1 Tax=Ascaris lumbricoides TaxID=6252 RepID=A0A9J2PRT8_ASCLU